MKFVSDHNSINVFDLEKSLAFYKKALGMEEAKRKEASDGSFVLVFLKGPEKDHLLELTWLRDRKDPYSLGDNEFHMAVRTDDYEGAHALHKEMDCIVYENEAMGLYFIADPDGYWTEILPVR